MTTKPKLDPARLTALKVIADERLAVSRATFETYRGICDRLTEQRRIIEQCENDADAAFPSQRSFFRSKVSTAKVEAERLVAERDAALARSEAATEASQTAGRLYQACRTFAIDRGIVADPQTGDVRKLGVAS